MIAKRNKKNWKGIEWKERSTIKKITKRGIKIKIKEKLNEETGEDEDDDENMKYKKDEWAMKQRT